MFRLASLVICLALPGCDGSPTDKIQEYRASCFGEGSDYKIFLESKYYFRIESSESNWSELKLVLESYAYANGIKLFDRSSQDEISRDFDISLCSEDDVYITAHQSYLYSKPFSGENVEFFVYSRLDESPWERISNELSGQIAERFSVRYDEEN